MSHSNLFDAPCVFCGYNGAGYWQSGTHGEHCPWHDLGGEAQRIASLKSLSLNNTRNAAEKINALALRLAAAEKVVDVLFYKLCQFDYVAVGEAILVLRVTGNCPTVEQFREALATLDKEGK